MLWRLHIRPASKNTIATVEYCIKNNIAGIGWSLDCGQFISSAEDYIEKAKAKYAGSVASINFARDIRKDDLVWARHPNGIYYLGKIDGDWRYLDSDDTRMLDIINQRPCTWIEIGAEENIPGKIVACFRPQRTLQRIPSERMQSFSKWLYNAKSGRQLYTDVQQIDSSRSASSFFEYIGDEDCEDIAGLFLQHTYGYYIIPSTCKHDTPGYEFVLTHKDPKVPKAIIQVKQGKVSLEDRWAKEALRVFLFSTEGYISNDQQSDVVILDKEELFSFVKNNLHMLPYRVRYWLQG